MHWGTFPGLEQDTEQFRVELETVSPETSLFAMHPGQSVELSCGISRRNCEASLTERPARD